MNIYPKLLQSGRKWPGPWFKIELIAPGVVRKTTETHQKLAAQVEQLCKRLIAKPENHIVPVYGYQMIGAVTKVARYNRHYPEMCKCLGRNWRQSNLSSEERNILEIKLCRQKRNLIRYSYEMAYLKPLSQEESYFINRKWSNDHYIDETSWKIKRVENLAKKYPKLAAFTEAYQWTYLDWHAGNVMRDQQGNFRIIDLEGFF